MYVLMAHSEEVLFESLSAKLAVEQGSPGFLGVVNVLMADSLEYRFESLSAGFAGEACLILPPQRRARLLEGIFLARTLRYR